MAGTLAYIGASRGVGFAAYAAVASADPDVRSVLMLRNPDGLRASPHYLSLGATIKDHTTLLMGDVHNSDSIEELLDECGSSLRSITYSVGMFPSTSYLVVEGQLMNFGGCCPCSGQTPPRPRSREQ